MARALCDRPFPTRGVGLGGGGESFLDVFCPVAMLSLVRNCVTLIG